MVDPYTHTPPPPGQDHPLQGHFARKRLADGYADRRGTAFAVVNGTAFAAHLVLACTAPGLLATRVSGETTAGACALLLQVLLLVWTAVRYDR
ncbi:hypothetical protein [Streptomyces lavendofoliae]|uniref:hypothetical protein n=1 Tax=Streptomyces lavendofoliae TaxID=67314 RepID=UPI00300F6343